jgi:hypothetical protein
MLVKEQKVPIDLKVFRLHTCTIVSFTELPSAGNAAEAFAQGLCLNGDMAALRSFSLMQVCVQDRSRTLRGSGM